MLELHLKNSEHPFLVNPDEIGRVTVKDGQVTIVLRNGRELLIMENYLAVCDKIATHDVPNIMRIIAAVIENNSKNSRLNTRQICAQLETSFKKLDSLFDVLSTIKGELAALNLNQLS